jgi:hypothetical protein
MSEMLQTRQRNFNNNLARYHRFGLDLGRPDCLAFLQLDDRRDGSNEITTA